MLDQRWALALDHITSRTEEEYYASLQEVNDWIKSQQANLVLSTVERRLTTRERQRRGLQHVKRF